MIYKYSTKYAAETNRKSLTKLKYSNIKFTHKLITNICKKTNNELILHEEKKSGSINNES